MWFDRFKQPALAAGLVVLAAACTSPPSGPRPNILLVSIDTLRADHCSAYGYPVRTTPVMDELASTGTLFETAYAPSATTSPSHATLLTSRYPRSLGLLKNGHIVEDDALTLAEYLRSHGYATAAFISSVPVRARFGFGQGFEHFDESFTKEDASIGRQKLRKPHDRRAGATASSFGRWLRQRDDDRPLFVWLHLVDPHAPYKAPEKFLGQWPKGTRGYIRRYDYEVHYADRHLGRVLSDMHAVEPDAGTLVVVTSDHGEGLRDHGWMAHGVNLYEEAVRVPLVVNWPGHVTASVRVAEPVGIIDIPPAIVSLLGMEVPEPFQGFDLFGQLRPDRAVYLQRRQYNTRRIASRRKGGVRKLRAEMHGVVKDRIKLISAPAEELAELYDLAADPEESENLAEKSPDRRHELERQIESWKEAVPSSMEEQPQISEEDKRALRALGYVD